LGNPLRAIMAAAREKPTFTAKAEGLAWEIMLADVYNPDRIEETASDTERPPILRNTAMQRRG
jgi:hypothetical protein